MQATALIGGSHLTAINMKSLEKLNNVEKGKLLADLFPNEIPTIIEFIKAMYTNLTNNETIIKKDWNNGFIQVEFWYRIAKDVQHAINSNSKMILKSRCFADQLFDHYNALYTIDCIAKYADMERKGSNFYHLVNALFNFEPVNPKS